MTIRELLERIERIKELEKEITNIPAEDVREKKDKEYLLAILCSEQIE